MSWVLLFAPDLWPEQAREWYGRYERSFWQDRGWAAGFREYARGTEPDWTFEVDAGPVLDGFGTSASAFGIAAARRNGRFDEAFTLSSELVAASWPLPDGTLALPRAFSHAADAPYLGEAGILYFMTVQPAPGVPVVRGGHATGLVYFGLNFGVTLAVGVFLARQVRRFGRVPATPVSASGASLLAVAVLGALVLALLGHVFGAALSVALAILVPWWRRAQGTLPVSSASRMSTP